MFDRTCPWAGVPGECVSSVSNNVNLIASTAVTTSNLTNAPLTLLNLRMCLIASTAVTASDLTNAPSTVLNLRIFTYLA